ncbi:MAG: tRNA 5-hydroxyuridine modification protein YegQ [Magnetococcales bacterium]|nr:tRNA 5-hydroxyuridine modification protein YegQ [Magnetococcales bacterium]
MKKPELLSPAGTLQSLRYAVAYGADAVYAGLPRYSLRVRENEFDLKALKSAVDHIRKHNRRLYIACNLAPHNSKVDTFLRDVDPMVELAPDALIMSDPGLINMAKKAWPHMPIHLSVQANVVNYAAVDFWKEMGLSRIILSRELSIEEIEVIRNRCTDMELEVFIHGALCIAYSGRCLLSGYMNHRDANQGSCTNSCRWDYKLHEAKQTETGAVVPIHRRDIDNKMYLLEDPSRPGALMPTYEDEHGTYIMNSKDLRAVQHVERFTNMGLDSLKIEGRTKSYFYTARTTQVYRQAIDAAAQKKPFQPVWYDNLANLANRGYTEGFYRRHPPQEHQNYLQGSSQNGQQFVGEVIDQNQSLGQLTILVKNHFEVGDNLELITPQGNYPFVLQHMETLKGEKKDIAPGSGITVVIAAPFAGGAEYGLLIKSLGKAA